MTSFKMSHKKCRIGDPEVQVKLSITNNFKFALTNCKLTAIGRSLLTPAAFTM